MSPEEFIHSLQDIIKVRLHQSRVHSNKECIVHDLVSILQVADNPMAYVLERWMTQQIAAEQIACLNVRFFQKPHQLISFESAVLLHRQDETEPSRIALEGGFRKQQEFGVFPESVTESLKIALSGFDELGELENLRGTDRRLHIRHLQVIANVGIYVFVVIAVWQRAELLSKSLAARVVITAIAVTVSSPISE